MDQNKEIEQELEALMARAGRVGQPKSQEDKSAQRMFLTLIRLRRERLLGNSVAADQPTLSQ